MADVKVVALDGYNDGYYWDMRAVYEYKGKTFVLINVGSGSGWIKNHAEVGYYKGELLSDWAPMFEEEVSFSKRLMINSAEKLIKSGEDTFVLWDDDDDYYCDENEEVVGA